MTCAYPFPVHLLEDDTEYNGWFDSLVLAHDVKEKTGFGNARAVCDSRDRAKGVKGTKSLQ